MGLGLTTRDYIGNAARTFGVSERYLSTTAYIESSGDVNALSGSHQGLFQFSPQTAAQYGLTNAFDGQQSSNAAAMLANDNQRMLERALGRPVTENELYLAHQQGATGAIRLLQGGEQLAANLVGLKAVTGNGFPAGTTASAFVAGTSAMYDRKAGEIGMGESSTIKSLADAGAPDTSWTGQFVRGVVVITGFIFLTVGISMFRTRSKQVIEIANLPGGLDGAGRGNRARRAPAPKIEAPKDVKHALSVIDASKDEAIVEPLKRRQSGVVKSQNVEGYEKFQSILGKIAGIIADKGTPLQRSSTDVATRKGETIDARVIDNEPVKKRKSLNTLGRKRLSAAARKVIK